MRQLITITGHVIAVIHIKDDITAAGVFQHPGLRVRVFGSPDWLRLSPSNVAP